LVLEKNRKTISRFNTENVSNSSFFWKTQNFV
jgi:hypothetical protein